MISSTKNPRIVEARKLSQRKHRLRQNRFLVDGLQLLSMAAANGRVSPSEIFYCEALFTGDIAPRVVEALRQAGGHPFAVAPNVMATLSERDAPQGVVATFPMDGLACSLTVLLATAQGLGNLSNPTAADSDRVAASENGLLLILDRLQDPGNLGTLLRTADAVGALGAILLEPCVDPFDPKTVRGTMGSLFSLPFARVDNVEMLVEQVQTAGYRLVGADGQQGELAWQGESLRGNVALVLGNEARGLSQDVQAQLRAYVRLPLRGQAESLNVAVAGGTLMYEWLRLNTAQP